MNFADKDYTHRCEISADKILVREFIFSEDTADNALNDEIRRLNREINNELEDFGENLKNLLTDVMKYNSSSFPQIDKAALLKHMCKINQELQFINSELTDNEYRINIRDEIMYEYRPRTYITVYNTYIHYFGETAKEVFHRTMSDFYEREWEGGRPNFSTNISDYKILYNPKFEDVEKIKDELIIVKIPEELYMKLLDAYTDLEGKYYTDWNKITDIWREYTKDYSAATESKGDC